jgi:iron uptake system component EfeO
MIRKTTWLRPARPLLFALALAAPACQADNDRVLADAAREEEAIASTRALLVVHAETLHDSVVALCAAAPAPAEGGWVHPRDDAAIKAMMASWQEARLGYDGLAGVMSRLPPERALDLDARYEQALEAGPDPDPFDQRGFIGLHALERVLWAERVPAAVLAYEGTLEGALAPAFPASKDEATRFRDELCARAVEDTGAVEGEVEALSLDALEAYAIVDRLADGQIDMLSEAGEQREASRYAGFTLADLRARLSTAAAVQAAFRPWLGTKSTGPHVDEEVQSALDRLDKQYAAYGTDALPAPPEGWSNTAFSEEALKSPFGRLYAVVVNETNSDLDGSLTHSWHECATLLGIDVP